MKEELITRQIKSDQQLGKTSWYYHKLPKQTMITNNQVVYLIPSGKILPEEEGFIKAKELERLIPKGRGNLITLANPIGTYIVTVEEEDVQCTLFLGRNLKVIAVKSEDLKYFEKPTMRLDPDQPELLLVYEVIDKQDKLVGFVRTIDPMKSQVKSASQR